MVFQAIPVRVPSISERPSINASSNTVYMWAISHGSPAEEEEVTITSYKEGWGYSMEMPWGTPWRCQGVTPWISQGRGGGGSMDIPGKGGGLHGYARNGGV